MAEKKDLEATHILTLDPAILDWDKEPGGTPEMLKMLDFIPETSEWPERGSIPGIGALKFGEDLFHIIVHAPLCRGCNNSGCALMKALIVHGIEHTRTSDDRNGDNCLNCARSSKVFRMITSFSSSLHLPHSGEELLTATKEVESQTTRQRGKMSNRRHMLPNKKRRKSNGEKLAFDQSGNDFSPRPMRQSKRGHLFSECFQSDLPTNTSTLSDFLDTVEQYDTSEWGEADEQPESHLLTFDTLNILETTASNEHIDIMAMDDTFMNNSSDNVVQDSEIEDFLFLDQC